MKQILISSLVILLFWAVFMPALEYPDEQAHFASVAWYSQHDRMPSGEEKDVSRELKILEEILGTFRDSQGNNRYTYHPENKHLFSDDIYGPSEQAILEANTPTHRSTYLFKEAARYPALFYAYTGIFYEIASQKSILDRLFIVRIGAVLLGVVNVYCAYKIGKQISGNGADGKVVALLVALQPMMVFVMSGVNSDSLHNVLFSLIVLCMLNFIHKPQAGGSLVGIALFFFADINTKPQAYIAIPIVVIAFIARAIYQREWRSSLKYALVVVVAAVVYGLLSNNTIIRDFIASGKLPYVSQTLHPNAPTFTEYAKYSLERLLHQNIVWFWGVFKWLGVVLPRPIWWIANRLVLYAAIGLLILLIKNASRQQRVTLLFALSTIAVYMGSIFWFDWQYIRSHGVQVAVQARYYFPVFTLYMSMLLMGIKGWSRSQTYQENAVKVTGLFFIVMQLVGIYTIAQSYYDTTSLGKLFIQASQYKPLFAKGETWWIWSSAYLIAIGTLIRCIFTLNPKNKQS